MSTAPPSLDSSSPEDAAPSPEGPPGWPPWFERVVLPYIEESSLWIVFVVLLAHGVMVLSVAQLFAVRDRHFGAGAGLIFLTAASIEICRKEYDWHHKFGVLTATVAGCWLVAVGVAVAASHYGVL